MAMVVFMAGYVQAPLGVSSVDVCTDLGGVSQHSHHVLIILRHVSWGEGFRKLFRPYQEFKLASQKHAFSNPFSKPPVEFFSAKVVVQGWCVIISVCT